MWDISSMASEALLGAEYIYTHQSILRWHLGVENVSRTQSK